jgi:hypothetical protein
MSTTPERTMRTWLSLLVLLLAATGTGQAAQGQRAETSGEYTVHYNALPTTVLGVEVARGYGIVRSATRGFVNIAVLRQGPDEDIGTAVAARVEASVRNLSGQRNRIELREIRDQDAIYYFGEFSTRGDDTLRFEIQVTPEGSTRTIPVRFEQAFPGN